MGPWDSLRLIRTLTFVSGIWETHGIEQWNGVGLGFLAKVFPRKKVINSEFSAVRMSRDGHHYYTILASDSGFEFVFQTGKDRWSTISPSLASRLIEKNRHGEIGLQIAAGRKQFLNLAIGSIANEETSWTPSKEIVYTTRELALRAEREILDISWAKQEDKSDG